MDDEGPLQLSYVWLGLNKKKKEKKKRNKKKMKQMNRRYIFFADNETRAQEEGESINDGLLFLTKNEHCIQQLCSIS